MIILSQQWCTSIISSAPFHPHLGLLIGKWFACIKKVNKVVYFENCFFLTPNETEISMFMINVEKHLKDSKTN